MYGQEAVGSVDGNAGIGLRAADDAPPHAGGAQADGLRHGNWRIERPGVPDMHFGTAAWCAREREDTIRALAWAPRRPNVSD